MIHPRKEIGLESRSRPEHTFTVHPQITVDNDRDPTTSVELNDDSFVCLNRIVLDDIQFRLRHTHLLAPLFNCNPIKLATLFVPTVEMNLIEVDYCSFSRIESLFRPRSGCSMNKGTELLFTISCDGLDNKRAFLGALSQ
jgi:hypothetical protein